MENRRCYVALYERLSRDDDLQGESNSIVNQKAYLEDYYKRHLVRDYPDFKHFTDDGYSGVTFDRPGFNEMLSEIRAGYVGAVVVKDLSRLGRNYLQVGYFTEVLFPDYNIRFIAINNSVDSASGIDNELTPFINVMNEWYAKDTSRKIRAVLKSKMKAGIRTCRVAPFGYYLNPGENILKIDSSAAAVVRGIFNMAAKGMSLRAIAMELRRKQVLLPAAYSKEFRPSNYRNVKFRDPCLWTSSTVRDIILREDYTGSTFLGKSEIINFKTKKKRIIPRDEQYIFLNTHDAIVDKELYDRVRRIVSMRRNYDPNNKEHETSRLSGMCFCSDCGKRLFFHSGKYAHRPNNKRYEADNYFMCTNYLFDKDSCSPHYIRSCVIETYLLKVLKQLRKVIDENEPLFVQTVQALTIVDREEQARENKKERDKMSKRVNDLDKLIKKLYEDNKSGRVSDRLFTKLLRDYDEEQLELEHRLHTLEVKGQEIREVSGGTDRFVRAVRRQRDPQRLTDLELNELIDKIVIHNGEGRGKKRVQRLDIYFAYIGYVNMDKLEDAIELDDAFIEPAAIRDIVTPDGEEKGEVLIPEVSPEEHKLRMSLRDLAEE